MFRENFALAEPVSSGLVRSGQSQAQVESEYGRLRSVLLADPQSLTIVPCNSVSEEAIRRGHECQRPQAIRQHAQLRAALAAEDVAIQLVPGDPGLPDLSFTRDSSLMSPWGLLGLRPGAEHREREVDLVMQFAHSMGLPWLGRVDQGRVEGGDLAMIRPGTVAIGISGVRTDDAGADAVASLFEGQGWEVLAYRFDPHFLHLDTIFCMVDAQLALACLDVLDDDFILAIRSRGIELVDVSYKDARRLGCNLLSLGDRRVITSGTSPRADLDLAQRGYRVINVELSEFIQCG
ncbi:MAG: dimethylarginine dimethylaminohydrolase family protein, partial [Allosphingosinicella sp.]